MAKGTNLHDPELCPVRDVIANFGDKWSILVIVGLRQGSRRFSELRRDLPDISQRMLTQTLRKLEREGLVSRAVTPSIPPRVDYALTGLGQSLIPPLIGLAGWAVEHGPSIVAARARFDRAAA